jgi:drug/metabolite transporter (DMT)-like permease
LFLCGGYLIGHDLAAVVFSLASALSWGAGDFSGGLATKRVPVFTVLTIGHGVGLLLLIGLALLWGEPIPANADLAWGFAAGIAGVVGIAALYRALAVGRMGLAAPVSGVITAALPALFGVVTEGLPSALTLVGFGLALLGVWLVAGAGGAEGGRAGLGLALLAGCGFGVFFILVDRAGASAVFWPLAAARCGSLALVVPIALGRGRAYQSRGALAEDRSGASGSKSSALDSQISFRLKRRQFVPVLLSGAFDVAGNAFFVLATQSGRLDVAAILSSMYPASTVLLAALLLGERVTRAQAAGIGAVLAAIALIAR